MYPLNKTLFGLYTIVMWFYIYIIYTMFIEKNFSSQQMTKQKPNARDKTWSTQSVNRVKLVPFSNSLDDMRAKQESSIKTKFKFSTQVIENLTLYGRTTAPWAFCLPGAGTQCWTKGKVRLSVIFFILYAFLGTLDFLLWVYVNY